MDQALVVVVRGIIAFLTLLIYTRLLGKQQISQLTFFDYVLGITIGSTASSLTTDISIRAWPQWVGLTLWCACVYLLQLITLKWRYASKYIDGEPTVVIINGMIMEDALRKMRFRVSDLLEQLREKGAFDLSQIEFAVLETSGKISVLKKSQYQSVTPKDLNLQTDYKGISVELIYDGVVVEQNLKQVNLSRQWLDRELKKQGITDVSEVFLANLNTSGNLYIDKYSDYIKDIPDISDYKTIDRR